MSMMRTCVHASSDEVLSDDQNLISNKERTPASPVPYHLRFDHIDLTWDAAGSISNECMPQLSGSFESRVMLLNAKKLIQAVILHVMIECPPTQQHLNTVKKLLEAEVEQPGVLFSAMMASKDSRVSEEAKRAHGNRHNPWFGGLSQALLCVRNWS